MKVGQNFRTLVKYSFLYKNMIVWVILDNIWRIFLHPLVTLLPFWREIDLFENGAAEFSLFRLQANDEGAVADVLHSVGCKIFSSSHFLEPRVNYFFLPFFLRTVVVGSWRNPLHTNVEDHSCSFLNDDVRRLLVRPDLQKIVLSTYLLNARIFCKPGPKHADDS
jgi:hypothetical protein